MQPPIGFEERRASRTTSGVCVWPPCAATRATQAVLRLRADGPCETVGGSVVFTADRCEPSSALHAVLLCVLASCGSFGVPLLCRFREAYHTFIRYIFILGVNYTNWTREASTRRRVGGVLEPRVRMARRCSMRRLCVDRADRRLGLGCFAVVSERFAL